MTPIPGRRTEHQGIRVQLLGEVELASERGHPHQFLSLGACLPGVPAVWPVRLVNAEPACQLSGIRCRNAGEHDQPSAAPRMNGSSDNACRPAPPAVRDLAPPGELTTQASLPFEFGSVEMQYESYRGAQVGVIIRALSAGRVGMTTWLLLPPAPPPSPPPLPLRPLRPLLLDQGVARGIALHGPFGLAPHPALQAQVRYLLRVTVARSLGGSVVKDHAFWVRNTQEVPPPGPPIKVGWGGRCCGGEAGPYNAAGGGGVAPRREAQLAQRGCHHCCRHAAQCARPACSR